MPYMPISYFPACKMSHALGYLPDKKDPRDHLYGSTFHAISTPPMVDYTPEMTEVKSQGAKGACVAFAVCAIKEWQEYIQRGKTEKWDFSEEFIYDHVQVYPGGGSYPREALKVLMNVGVPLESQFPYTGGSDKYKLEPPVKNTKDQDSMHMFGAARRFRASGYVRLRNLEEVMQSLAVNGPCFLGVRWLSGWYDADETWGGMPLLKAYDGSVSGGHAVTIVGYNRRARLLKIRNQWGASWGGGGYAYMTFEAFDQCAVDTWALYDVGTPLKISG